MLAFRRAAVVPEPRLSPADREVLTLSAWYDLPADEAARVLQCSSSSAYRVRLFRARRRLAELLTRPASAGVTAFVAGEVPDVR